MEEDRQQERFDYTQWQQKYFDKKSLEEISREASQFEAEHPYQGTGRRI